MQAHSIGPITVMDYMKVVNRLQDDYIAAEKAWKPVHQARIHRGILKGWYLYKVHFAYHDNPYNFATINAYDQFSQLEDPYPRELIAAAHPDKGYDGFEDLTEEARRKVRSEMSVLEVSSAAGNPAVLPSKYLKVAFIQVEEQNMATYIVNETKVWKEVHAYLEKEGIQDWWAVYKLEYPHGKSVNYQFLTISAVSAFCNLNELDYFGAYEKVHPETPLNFALSRTLGLRTTYRAELWELVDYLEA